MANELCPECEGKGVIEHTEANEERIAALKAKREARDAEAVPVQS